MPEWKNLTAGGCYVWNIPSHTPVINISAEQYMKFLRQQNIIKDLIEFISNETDYIVICEKNNKDIDYTILKKEKNNEVSIN